MRQIFYLILICCAVALSGMQFTACKKEKTVVEDNTTVETATTEEMPVEIAADDELQNNVTDAIKDFPGVSATVADGEITLTGEITRDRLPMLMQSLHALNPKKINNNLTIK